MNHIGEYKYDEFEKDGEFYFRLGAYEWYKEDTQLNLHFLETQDRKPLEDWYQKEFLEA